MRPPWTRAILHHLARPACAHDFRAPVTGSSEPALDPEPNPHPPDLARGKIPIASRPADRRPDAAQLNTICDTPLDDAARASMRRRSRAGANHYPLHNKQ